MTSLPNLSYLALSLLPALKRFPYMPNKWGYPLHRAYCSAHLLCEAIRTDSCWAGGEGIWKGWGEAQLSASGGSEQAD